MFNKYSLKFLFKDQEESYQVFIASRVRKELTNFTIYAFIFSLLNFAQFIMQQSALYSIVSAVAALLIYLVWYKTYQNTQLINNAVIFYQLLILFGYEINSFLSSGDRAQQQFAWYYGYQCGFSHFFIYLQGSNFISQSILLIFVNGVHLYFSDLSDALGIMNLIMFLLITSNMIAMKYIYERIKKEEYFYSHQQKQWEQLMQRIISNYIMLVRYDDKQDQLRLVQQSKMVQQNFLIDDCPKMRNLLRELKLHQNVNMNSTQFSACNLEQIVRKILIIDDHTDIFKENDCAKLIVRNSISREQYKVKLMHIIQNNELHCLIVLTQIQIQTDSMKIVEKCIIEDLTENGLSNSQQLIGMMQVCKGKLNISQKQITQQYFIHNFILNIKYLITFQLLNQLEIKVITKEQLFQQFQQIFAYPQNQFYYHGANFKSNMCLLIQAIINCIELMQFIDPNQPPWKTKIKVQQHIVDISLEFRMDNTCPALLNIIESSWSRNQQRKYKYDSNYKLTLNRMYVLYKTFNFPPLIVIKICIMQLILARIGEINHPLIIVTKDTIKLTLKITNHDRISTNSGIMQQFQ